MPLTKIQQNVISIFNSNEFLQKKRDGLSLKEKDFYFMNNFFSTSFGSNVQFTSTSTQTTIRDGKRIVTTIHTSNGKTTKTIEEFPM